MSDGHREPAGRAGGGVPRRQAPRRRGHRGGARHQAHDPRGGGGGGPRDPGSGRGRGPLPRPPVLPDRQGAQGSDRPGGRRDRPRPARERRARPRLRGGRPLRSARHAPDVQGGDRPGAGGERGRGDAATGGVALPRRVAGVAGDGGDLAGPAVPGRAAPQDPGDLQAPVPEGHGARSRGPTSASSGSGSRRATRGRPRSWTGWGWRSTSRWRRT